jgi:tRNA-dihydrouridine synthase
MSKVPAHWDLIGEVAAMRNKLAPQTLIVGNGDVESRSQAEQLTGRYGLDGIMVGRGIFHDPFVFSGNPTELSEIERRDLYRRHVELFATTWQPGERPIKTLNKFCKMYIQGFDGAKELRERLMAANSTDELLNLL